MEPQQIYPTLLLSHDSDLLSLFHRCDSIEEDSQKIQKNLKQQENAKFFLSDLNLVPQNIEKGYYSDLHLQQKNPQRKNQRKPKQIINKKEKKKTKKRTRMYIQMLENRVQELQNELQKLKKMNKINKEYIQRLNESEQNINGYIVGRQQVYEKLEILKENINSNNKQESYKTISEEVSILRLRQGVFGKDRVKSVNYYFKEMVEMLLPQIQKYVIKSAQTQSDMFCVEYVKSGEHTGNMEDWRKKMLQEFNLKKPVREYFFSIKDRILQQKKIFDDLLENFYELKCNLTKQARKMEIVFDGVRQLMTPLQIARCLCYVDKYRYEKKLTVQQTAKSIFDKLKRQQTSYNIEMPFGQV